MSTATWSSSLGECRIRDSKIMSPAGFGPENDCADEDQQQLLTTDPSPRQRERYIRNTSARVQMENKITSRGSQEACRQDERIAGKPPVVK
jgi:hypothetical protein